MQTQKSEEEYTLSIEQEQDMMAKFFFSSAREVLLEAIKEYPDKGVAIADIIQNYIRTNPLGDVLPQTQDLFQRMPIPHISNISPIDTNYWFLALTEIKSIYCSALPAHTTKKYASEINLFFDRLERYGYAVIENIDWQ